MALLYVRFPLRIYIYVMYSQFVEEKCMQIYLIIAAALHVLAAVFWAGSTFVLARSAAVGAERLWRPQLGAAAVTTLSGGYLWSALHRGQFDDSERVLAVGIVAALVAAALQATVGRTAARAPERNPADPTLRRRTAIIQIVASAPLALTIICMAVSRYV
jgi:hypothetical protein